MIKDSNPVHFIVHLTWLLYGHTLNSKEMAGQYVPNVPIDPSVIDPVMLPPIDCAVRVGKNKRHNFL